jgi:hypothetical protein
LSTPVEACRSRFAIGSVCGLCTGLLLLLLLPLWWIPPLVDVAHVILLPCQPSPG